MRRVFCALLLVLISAAGLKAQVAIPAYQGRPLDSWLQDLKCQPCGPEHEPAVNAIRAMGATAIPYLLQRIEQRDGLAAQAIGVLGPVARSAVPALTALFTQDPSNASAATALVSLSAEKPVIEALSSPTPDVRATAIVALGFGGSQVDAAAVPALIANLETGSRQTRSDVIWALSMIHKRGDLVIPALLRLVDDRDPWLRGQAIAALAGFSLPRTIDRLIKGLDDPDAGVRGDVARALGEAIDRTTDDALVGRIVAALIVRLRDSSDDVRVQAAWALGAVGHRANSAISELTRLTKDANPSVSQMASASLAHVNDTTRD